MQMKRDDYKAVKRMDRIQLSAYVERVYTRGYDAGLKAAATAPKSGSGAQPSPTENEQDTEE